MNKSNQGRLKYVLAMLGAWVGLYGVAILAMYTAGCNGDSGSLHTETSQEVETTPYTAIDAPAETEITTQGEFVSAVDEMDVADELVAAAIVESEPEVEAERKMSPDNEPAGTPVVALADYAAGEALYRAGDYSAAADVFSAYTETRPQNLWGYYMLGLACWKSGDLSGATAALEMALTIDDTHLKSHLNLARVHLAAGEYSQAHSHAMLAVAMAPEEATSHRILGRTFHNLGMAEEAIAAYRTALRFNAGDAWSFNNIGLILIEEERFLESLGPLARAIELRDDVAVFRNNLGVALERTGRYEAAAEAYRAVLEIEMGYSRAATNLARVEALTEAMGQSQWDLAAMAHRFVQGLAPETPQSPGAELTEATSR